MNKKELKRALINAKIPNDMYCLNGGLPNEAFCLQKGNDNWEVYYSERGRKSGLKLFTSEDEACKAIFELIYDTYINL